MKNLLIVPALLIPMWLSVSCQQTHDEHKYKVVNIEYDGYQKSYHFAVPKGHKYTLTLRRNGRETVNKYLFNRQLDNIRVGDSIYVDPSCRYPIKITND